MNRTWACLQIVSRANPLSYAAPLSKLCGNFQDEPEVVSAREKLRVSLNRSISSSRQCMTKSSEVPHSEDRRTEEDESQNIDTIKAGSPALIILLTKKYGHVSLWRTAEMLTVVPTLFLDYVEIKDQDSVFKRLSEINEGK